MSSLWKCAQRSSTDNQPLLHASEAGATHGSAVGQWVELGSVNLLSAVTLPMPINVQPQKSRRSILSRGSAGGLSFAAVGNRGAV